MKEAVGGEWQDAIHALLARGFPVETLLGYSGSRSFRLVERGGDRMVSVSLPVAEWRTLLTGQPSDAVVDAVSYAVASAIDVTR